MSREKLSEYVYLHVILLIPRVFSSIVLFIYLESKISLDKLIYIRIMNYKLEFGRSYKYFLKYT